MIKKRAGRKLDSVLERKQILFICDRGWLSILDGCCQTPHAVLLSRGRKKTNLHPFDLAPYWGLPSQYLSILLVRSYRTFAPLPILIGGIFLWHYPRDRSHWELPSKYGLSGVQTFLKPASRTDLQPPRQLSSQSSLLSIEM